MSLCYRCEHRAAFLEGGPPKRYECGMKNRTVTQCHVFQPVRPPLLIHAGADRRKLKHKGNRFPDLEFRAMAGEEDVFMEWVANPEEIALDRKDVTETWKSD